MEQVAVIVVPEQVTDVKALATPPIFGVNPVMPEAGRQGGEPASVSEIVQVTPSEPTEDAPRTGGVVSAAPAVTVGPGEVPEPSALHAAGGLAGPAVREYVEPLVL